MSSDAKLEAIFNPRSVAVAGAGGLGAGQAFLTCLLDSGFRGKVYPLSPKRGESLGLKVYPNVRDVPDEVDFVISCIPAHLAPQLVDDCIAKGVKAVSFYTAGFGERGDEEGQALDTQILQKARAGGLRILGPNCVGVYNPKVGLSFSSDNPRESGRVGFISQSGGNIIYTVRAAGCRGVRFSKAVSYGNALDIDETELLEYLSRDTETEIVAVYVEGVSDGEKFFRVLKAVSSRKPLIILKAGRTDTVARAVSSHTGALAGADAVWDRLLDQAGAIRVYNLDELVDMLVAFSFLGKPRARAVALLGGGGGINVMAADEYVACGFSLPPIPSGIQDSIRKDIVEAVRTEAGFILTNPFDLTNLHSEEGQYKVFSKLANWDEVDMMVAQTSVNNSGWPYPGYGYSAWPDMHIDAAIRVHKETGKPIAVVVHSILSMWDCQRSLDLQQKCVEGGLAVFRSVPAAAKAMDRFMRYWERRAAR